MKQTGTHTNDRLLLIGVGNPLRGDDALGHALAEQLIALKLPGLRCRQVQQLHLELLQDLHEADVVIVADASLAASGCELKELRPASGQAQPMAEGHRADAETLQALYKQLYQRPLAWWVLAMGAASFDMGAPLSSTAQRNLTQAQVLLRQWMAGPAGHNKS
jgi:hydrogenase maturation protease